MARTPIDDAPTGIPCLNMAQGKDWTALQGDCVEITKHLPSASIGFSIYSPPFSNLFIYSDSASDMGNCKTDDEFFEHYSYLLKELLRLTKPGRLSAVHCSDLPLQKWKDGVMGIKDFSGRIIAAHEALGWILHSRTTIWKDPVVEMTRTKALGLLYKQLKKDSVRSRTGMPDYLLVFRAPGENAEPVEHMPDDFPVEKWQKWASPVWMDIRQTNTLNAERTREPSDEKHIAPLQLDLIERALILWSNPGDIVLSPFMGIGSEGYISLLNKRRFIGTELKEAYWRKAVYHLENAKRTRGFFDE